MTSVDIVIRLQIVGTPKDMKHHLDALHNLGEVMAVQAEGGLWSLGSEDAENEEGPSTHLAHIITASVRGVTVCE